MLRRLALALALLSGCSSAPPTRAPAPRRAREVGFEAAREASPEGPSRPNRRRGPEDPEVPALDALAREVGARSEPLRFSDRLERFFSALDALDERLLALEALDRRIARLEATIRAGVDRDRNTIAKQRAFRERAALEATARELSVRVLHLGDSHIAADYVTRTVRARLQARFGDGGRGFVSAEQKALYGGRRLRRPGWSRTRLADRDGAGQPLGVAGVRLRATRSGAEVRYLLEGARDRRVRLFFHRWPGAPALELFADAVPLGVVETSGAPGLGEASVAVDLPPPPPERLTVRARGEGAVLLGASFETGQPGVLYDAVGPVGADARVWLSVPEDSSSEHVARLGPELIVVMLGGNDALAVRRGRRTLEAVETDLSALLERLGEAAPDADCLLFGPMDAAVRRSGGALETRSFVREVVELQARVARRRGCAFWDAFSAMGGEGSFGRWLEAGLVNDDLIHPRSRGGDLLGHLFARALREAYLR